MLLLLSLALAQEAERPTLSGEVVTVRSADGWFDVHFTREGSDAPQDADTEDVPPLVQGVLAGLMEGRSAFEERGYRPLVRDGGRGGSAAIDVYIHDVDINGYAHPADPADDVTVGRSCWLEVDAFLDLGRVPDSVAAHELHHCVQYRYTSDTHSWIYESTATFEQYRLLTDPALTLAADFLWITRLGAPERPLHDTGDRFEYAGFIFMKFWEDFAGDPAALPALWEILAESPEWKEGLDRAAEAQWGLSLPDVLVEFGTYNAFACGRDDGQHYGPSVPCGVEVTVPIAEAFEGEPFEVVHEEAGLTITYAELSADGDDRPVVLSCTDANRRAQARVRLVAVDADGLAGERADVAVETDGEARLGRRLDPEGSVVAVIASSARPSLGMSCTFSRVEPTAEPSACGCSQNGPSSLWLFAACLVCCRRRVSSGMAGPLAPRRP